MESQIIGHQAIMMMINFKEHQELKVSHLTGQVATKMIKIYHLAKKIGNMKATLT